METVVLRTRLRADAIDEYELVHAVIPAAQSRAMRAAGVISWRIWRSGVDLFHLVEVENFDKMKEILADDAVDHAWQQQIRELLEPYTSETDPSQPARFLWALPELAELEDPA